MDREAVRAKPDTVPLSDRELDTVVGGASAGPGEHLASLKNILILSEDGPNLPPDERQQTLLKTR